MTQEKPRFDHPYKPVRQWTFTCKVSDVKQNEHGEYYIGDYTEIDVWPSELRLYPACMEIGCGIRGISTLKTGYCIKHFKEINKLVEG